MRLVTTVLTTPLGPLRLVGDEQVLRRAAFDLPRHPDWREGPGPLTGACDELDAYFAGERRQVTVPVRGEGTAWQRRVWSAVASIPYGETRTYGEIAAAIGRPGAARAVGAANAANPLCVIVPCHRVVDSRGRLAGYAGGLDRKRALLALERRGTAAG